MRKSHLVFSLVVASSVALAIGIVAAVAGNPQTGNGAPSGPHYNLNLIGFADGQTAKGPTGSGGNVIFVPLSGHCQIDLKEGDFSVLDNNCTDGTDAEFQLPNPDPTNSGTSEYSVYAAARGNPLGSATARSCFTDSTGQYCSVIALPLSKKVGPDQFMNATKYLLYVYACINGKVQRVPLFSDATAQYYWQYDNSGLRNAALRFYPGVQTTVPDGGQAC